MHIELLFPHLSRMPNQQSTKAKILIYVILASAIFCLGLSSLNTFEVINSEFPFVLMLTACIALLAIFRWTNSLLITTNLLLVIITYFTCRLSLNTGGIYSDDTLFMVTIPVIAYVLSEVHSAIFWLVATNAWAIYLCSLAATPEQAVFFRDQTLAFTPEYYLVFCIFTSCLLFVMLSIFYFENTKLIKKLEENQKALEIKNQEYSEQTKTLEATQERLKLSNQELEQYAHATSHDLKQPIRTINGFANLLKRNLKKREVLDERSDEFVNLIIKGTNSMLRLVNDLLASVSYTHLTLPTKRIV